MPPAPFLSASHIHKSFDGAPVLRGIDLNIARGETVCLLGPSGCGKTTLLRILAGLKMPDRGQIMLEGKEITGVAAHRRDFGLMFQDYALFPHMTVAENIAFGLKMQGWSGSDSAGRVRELLDLVELEGYENRKVYELSGGEQQRVALARSLAPEPRLLMLDEPLGSLDRVLRQQLLTDLRLVLQRLGQTAVYVTHDQVEAFAVADRVVLMNKGCIEQQAAPDQLYRHPATSFAARFLGFKNIVPARIASLEPTPRLETSLGELVPLGGGQPWRLGEHRQVVIRPEGASIATKDAPAPNRLRLPVQFCSFRGSHTLLRLDSPAGELEFELSGPLPPLTLGDMITLDLDPAAIVVLSSTSIMDH